MFEIISEDEYGEDCNECECSDLDVVSKIWYWWYQASSDGSESNLEIIEETLFEVSIELSGEELLRFGGGTSTCDCEVEVSDSGVAVVPLT